MVKIEEFGGEKRGMLKADATAARKSLKFPRKDVVGPKKGVTLKSPIGTIPGERDG